MISLLVVDGVYVRGKDKLEFRRVSPPTKAELDALLKTIVNGHPILPVGQFWMDVNTKTTLFDRIRSR